MQKLKYKSLIGLRGVAHSENARARYWARKFEFPMIMMATWIIMEWYASAQGVFPTYLNVLTDWLVWGLFLIETVVLTKLVDNDGDIYQVIGLTC